MDKINRNMSNIIFTDINGNQNDNLQNNIKSGLSEKQIIQRRSKLILEEKNELNTKQEKSERTKKELQNIQEDETENKEKNDKQTSPLSLKINKNRIFNNSLLAPNKINSFTFERKELRNNNNAEEQKKFNSLQIKYKEDYEEIKFKFEDLFEKTKFKITDLTDHLNQLIIRMNKIIFNKKDNLRMIKDEEYIPERVHKKLFLDNSDKKIFLPLNKSSDEKLSKTVKHKDISKEESKININHGLFSRLIIHFLFFSYLLSKINFNFKFIFTNIPLFTLYKIEFFRLITNPFICETFYELITSIIMVSTIINNFENKEGTILMIFKFL